MVGGLTPGGDEFSAPQPGSFWAKITGNAAGTNRYAWTQIDTGDTTAFDTGLADSFAATGTSAATGAPAYEVNGRTGVATGTRVLLHPAGDLTFYVFGSPVTGTGSTATGADSCGWTVGATTTTCLRMTVVSAQGLCSGISTAQSIELIWDAGDARFESGASDFTGTGSGGTGLVTLDLSGATPAATIDGVSGKPMGCSGDGGLVFAFGGSVLCGNTAGTCNNYFTVRFDCECCSIAGWEGEGWYCVGGAPVYLTEDDRCDTDITIDSGVYATEAEAEAACAPVAEPSPTCPDPGNLVVGQSGAGVSTGPGDAGYFRATGLTPSTAYKFTVTWTNRAPYFAYVQNPTPSACALPIAGGTNSSPSYCVTVTTGAAATELVVSFEAGLSGSGNSNYSFVFESGAC